MDSRNDNMNLIPFVMPHRCVTAVRWWRYDVRDGCDVIMADGAKSGR
jgi:hypothetical protein